MPAWSQLTGDDRSSASDSFLGTGIPIDFSNVFLISSSNHGELSKKLLDRGEYEFCDGSLADKRELVREMWADKIKDAQAQKDRLANLSAEAVSALVDMARHKEGYRLLIAGLDLLARTPSRQAADSEPKEVGADIAKLWVDKTWCVQGPIPNQRGVCGQVHFGYLSSRFEAGEPNLLVAKINGAHWEFRAQR